MKSNHTAMCTVRRLHSNAHIGVRDTRNASLLVATTSHVAVSIIGNKFAKKGLLPFLRLGSINGAALGKTLPPMTGEASIWDSQKQVGCDTPQHEKNNAFMNTHWTWAGHRNTRNLLHWWVYLALVFTCCMEAQGLGGNTT